MTAAQPSPSRPPSSSPSPSVAATGRPGRVVLMMSVSLDGYFEGPDREIDWHLIDDELHQHFNDHLTSVGAFLDGRVTHELMAGFWPTADQDPDAAAPVREFARIWRRTPKYVYSRTLQQADWNTTVVRDVVPAEVAALTARHGDVGLGGARLAAAFRALDLIDEYRLYVHPVLLGRGAPLFPPAASFGVRPLRLVETRTFGNGVVLLRHERPRHHAAP